MESLLLVGGSGWIGSHLKKYLSDQGYRVSTLSRGSLEWDPERGVIELASLENYFAVINLAGESIMEGRWNMAKKERIYSSRVTTTKLLAEAISRLKNPPKLFLSSSAIGIYGMHGDEEVTEQTACGSGFLATVCQDWEKAAQLPRSCPTRVVSLRFGMVLGCDGGALKQMIPLFRYGLGGTIGSGKQWISWIAMEDLVRFVHFIIQRPNLSGAINVVSPYPVQQVEFAKMLAVALHRPALFPLPAWVVKCLFGEKGAETLLSSIRALPAVALEQGFVFRCPKIYNFDFNV